MIAVSDVFNCQRCGTCCLGRGGVRLGENEAQLAAEFLGLSLVQFKERYLESGPGPWDVGVGPDGYCLFHQPGEMGCLIHPVKPKICRLWPFLPGPLQVASAFKDAQNSCPGILPTASWASFKKAGQSMVHCG